MNHDGPCDFGSESLDDFPVLYLEPKQSTKIIVSHTDAEDNLDTVAKVLSVVEAVEKSRCTRDLDFDDYQDRPIPDGVVMAVICVMSVFWFFVGLAIGAVLL